jgi:threonine synthase
MHRPPDLAAMRRDLFSASISDPRTVAGVRDFWNRFQLLLEPHGAVAWQGFLEWNALDPLDQSPAVIVETANPAKFPVEVEKVVGWPPDVPENMLAALKLPEDFDRLGAEYEKFREYLLRAHA